MVSPAHIDPRRLRAFLVLAEELHFGRAAARLSVVQSTLTHHIKRLEAELGTTLFVRTTRRVTLTPAGEALAGGVAEPLRELELAVAAARDVGLGRAGTLRVGFVGSAANELTQPILRAFASTAPEIEVDLRSFDISDPTAGLLSADSDVAFVRDFRGHAELEHEAVLIEGRVFVMAADHPLAAETALREDQLEGVPTIALVRDRDVTVAGTWRERDTDVRRPAGGHASTIDTWLALVAAGRGVTSAPASAARYFARPGLTFVPAVDVEPSVVSLAWRRDARTPLVDRFVLCAHATTRQHEAPGAAAG